MPDKTHSTVLTMTSEMLILYLMTNKSKATKKPPGRDSDMIDVNNDDDILMTFILFVRSAQLVLKYADSTFYRKAKLSVIKFIVLRALANSGGVMRPHKIADWTQTERQNITALINRMRQEGLVEAERDSSDKRYVNVTLTDRGREALSLAVPAAREVINQVMSSISKEDTVLLKKLLEVLRKNAKDGFEHIAEQDSPQPDQAKGASTG
jgi:DNA-binding MarR family transcriptional regulator